MLRWLLLVILGFNISCDDNLTSKPISEGQIEFKVEYLDNERDKPLIVFLPNKVTTSFKENCSHTLIDGNLGIFKLIYIVNPVQNKNYSMLKLIDKKYVYETNLTRTAFGYQELENLRIEYSEKTKKIAGYECKHALAIYNSPADTIQLYYTDEIDIAHPNLNSPFKEIEGILMEFSVELAGINMKFTANKVRKTEIDMDLFNLPEGYLQISEKQMDEIINNYYYTSDK